MTVMRRLKTARRRASSSLRSDGEFSSRESLDERDCEQEHSFHNHATHYIDGAFVESHGREVMDIISPTSGKLIGRVTLADEEDTRRAIAAAKGALVSFGRSIKEERATILRRLHEAASARLDDLTAAMVEEYG